MREGQEPPGSPAGGSRRSRPGSARRSGCGSTRSPRSVSVSMPEKKDTPPPGFMTSQKGQESPPGQAGMRRSRRAVLFFATRKNLPRRGVQGSDTRRQLPFQPPAGLRSATRTQSHPLASSRAANRLPTAPAPITSAVPLCRSAKRPSALMQQARGSARTAVSAGRPAGSRMRDVAASSGKGIRPRKKPSSLKPKMRSFPQRV